MEWDNYLFLNGFLNHLVNLNVVEFINLAQLTNKQRLPYGRRPKGTGPNWKESPSLLVLLYHTEDILSQASLKKRITEVVSLSSYNSDSVVTSDFQSILIASLAVVASI